jgi:D-alanyl-lipoteichoic acid acyltransferase DltB (MBOAT superfamily)
MYMSFFPHLVAGPIVRASEFAPQLEVRADPRGIPSGEAFRLIAFGLFKKVVVSSYLATEIVDPVFGAPSAHGSMDLLVGVYAYAIQIYADFSGYTDIAIGCALLLGIRFPQNFDAPYRSLSIQEFWRRWHMTLSRWLRDYLYIPLGGSRHGERQTYRNLFLTMVIGGLWHGAAWTFLVWGALHGAYLTGERWVKGRWAAQHTDPVLPTEITAVLQWLLTFNLVCLAWIFFRAPSIGTAFEVIGGIVGGVQPDELVTGLILATIALMLASQFVPPRAVERAQLWFTDLGPGLQVAGLVFALTLTDVLGPDGVAPFIYFRF